MYLGIDIGTSGIKAVIVAESGSVLAAGTAPLGVSRPCASWSEQDPDHWWQATDVAVLALPGELRARVQGVGLAGQMHGATLLGADHRPLRPAILWNDGRSSESCRQLEQRAPESRSITGNLAMPGFTAPKLLWVREHEPEIFARVEKILLPKDYVRLCMTGDIGSDLSDSAGTLWLDVAARDWSEVMLAATGLSSNHMAPLFEGNAITGMLRPEVAAQWGMARVPVAAGGGDNAAGAVGIGVVNEGDALLSLGTSGVIFVATGAFRPNPERAVHAFCHCLPDMWHQMSVHLSAACCIDWGIKATGADDPADFFALAEAAGAGTGPEIFLPYLSGERTPHNDAHIRAAVLGIDNDTGRGRVAAAVLEGVAFAHADGIAVLRDAGTEIEELSVIGGGARSRYWGTIIAAALNVRLAYLEGGEVGPALGAAKLALMAVTGASATEACVRPPISHVIEPDGALADRLTPRLARFRAAYSALKSL